MRAIDPINPQGAEFVFRSDAPLNFFSFNPVVPAPDAKVDLWIAWREAQRDARACAEILRHDPSLAMALAIWRNVVAWQRFWAKRWPDPVMRERFAAAVEEFEEEEPVR